MVFILSMPFDSFASHKNHGKSKNELRKGPPSWAPAHGYRAKIRHVYFPEHNIYYDRYKEAYIYISMGKWEVNARLPLPLRNLDLYNATYVEIYSTDNAPHVYNSQHIARYRRYANKRYYAEKTHDRRYHR